MIPACVRRYTPCLWLGAGLALLSACGSSAEGTVGVVTQSSLDLTGLKGSWYRADTNETIDFNDSGSFTSTTCATKGTLEQISLKNQSFQITHFSVGTVTCSVPADRSCTYSISDKTLTLTCAPDGSGTYAKP